MLLFFVLSFLAGLFVFEINLPKSSSLSEETVFKIEKGEDSRIISLNLEKADLIRWSPIFRTYVHLKGVANKIQAGSYLLSPSMNIIEITEKLVKGDVIKEKITIIEGWDLRDIALYFEERGMFASGEFWETAGLPATTTKAEDFSLNFEFLKEKPKNISLEGYLFPDTYEIKPDDSLEDIIEKMLNNFDKKISPYKDMISGSGKTLFEIITMASLIEKEVKTKEDKELVSGILWKRLKNSMPLQVDATVGYILGEKKLRISIEESQIDSPYNTYKYRGLPLGPISNPGLDSILAAISLKESPFWYYLSKPNGETVFSKTLGEHEAAIEEYLR